MPQKQCQWCGKLGDRVDDRDLSASWAQPHADGSACVCRHITCQSMESALRQGGRYFDGASQQWVCFGCNPIPTNYVIGDATGSTAIDGGSDYADARWRAQAHASRIGAEAYLSERGADDDDFVTFRPE